MPHAEVSILESVHSDGPLMMFVSYAQNSEDVVLWRALRDVEAGFYVDVGAGGPTEDSVTKAFYERGWSGINIEPTEPYFTELQSERPRDVNLRVLAGAQAGVRSLHVIEGTGLSTLNENFAARHVKAGYESRLLVVPQLTLNQILESRANLPIHFLKIDVEGAEAEVLSGIDLKAFRPWIILVEATEPNSEKLTCSFWEGLLIDRGYEFIYFDGLNRFYTAIEQPHLKEKLAVPPNVFDNFLRAPEACALEELAKQTRRAEELTEDFEAKLRAESARLETELERAHGEMRSLSDRVTGVSRNYDILVEEHNNTLKTLNKLNYQFSAAEAQSQYLLHRSALERLLFRVDGRPTRLLRRLLFHNSGAPRRFFRILVLHKSGEPRRAFSYWLKNQLSHLHYTKAAARETFSIDGGAIEGATADSAVAKSIRSHYPSRTIFPEAARWAADRGQLTNLYAYFDRSSSSAVNNPYSPDRSVRPRPGFRNCPQPNGSRRAYRD